MMKGNKLGTVVGRILEAGRMGAGQSGPAASKWVGVLAALCVGVLAAGAQKPAVVINQTRLLAGYPNGGALGSGSAAGSNFAVNSAGNLIASTTYGGSIVQFNAAAGGVTTLGSYSNGGPIAVDSNDNIYIADTYDAYIVKVPYTGGAYAPIKTASTSTPACVGSDTTECLLPSLTTNGIYGYASMAFDATGNLYFSSTNGGTFGNGIYECNLACLKVGGTAVLLYQEPATTTTNPDKTVGQALLGGLAIDSFGDVFFSDSVIYAMQAESSSSNLKELKYSATSTTLHAAVPTVLYTLTNAMPGAYNNQLVGVALDANQNVYFTTEFDGIFGLLNNAGAVDTTSLYTVSTQGAKLLASNLKGSFYIATYSNATSGDAAMLITVGSAMGTAAGVGATTTATNLTTILNSALSCGGTTPVFTSTTTEFSATTSSTACTTANLSSASAYPTTLTFTPSASGTRTATLTATSGSVSGTATVSGVGIGSATATPTFTPAGGTYTTIQSVTIADTTAGATFYYTTDGTTPTTSSTLYSGPISVGMTETLKAIAVVSGSSNSGVATASYVINLPAAATPTATPAAGTYMSTQNVVLADATAGATIFYTVDGSTPTTSSTKYTAAIAVTATETIKALATATGYNASAVGSFAYTINLPAAAVPVLTPAPGTYLSAQMVTIADSTPGAKIYFTTDGSMPTTSSTLYTAAISVQASETIQAIAAASGYNPSGVATGVYTIKLPAALPSFTPAPGTFQAVQTVTIADGTMGAVIYYTTDGTTPNTTSAVYKAPIAVNATETIQAIALAPGGSVSAVSPATYTITLPNYTLAVNPNSLTVSAGGQGLVNVTVTPQNGFLAPVTFACSGLPTGANCVFSPASLVPTGTTSVTSVMAINLPAATMSAVRDERLPLFPTAAVAAACCMLGWRKRRGVRLLLVLLLSVAGMSLLAGCGGASTAATGAGVTSTVTVTATSGALVKTATMSLIVQ